MALAAVGIGVKASGRSAWLDAPAAESYKRMLKAGCPGGCITDAGRTYAEQVEIFTARYTTNYAASSKADRRVWNGRTWWRKPGVASAATPGASKHETGCALDLAEPARSWVRAHGAEYGWLRDRVKSEPWHLEYHAAYDKHAAEPPQEDDMPLTDTDAAIIRREAHDATVSVMRSDEFRRRLRDEVTAAVRAAIPEVIQAVLDAEVPEHDELTGRARRLAYVVRDARINSRRILRHLTGE